LGGIVKYPFRLTVGTSELGRFSTRSDAVEAMQVVERYMDWLPSIPGAPTVWIAEQKSIVAAPPPVDLRAQLRSAQ
jgi:hypothetical protein